MTAFEFYNRCGWKGKLLILKTLLELPAAVFHETCHIIGAILTGSTILKVEVLYFYEVEGNTIKSYACNVTTNTKGSLLYLRCLIVNTAPVLGVAGLLVIDYDFIYWIIISFKTFWLSDQDIKNVRSNFKSLFK